MRQLARHRRGDAASGRQHIHQQPQFEPGQRRVRERMYADPIDQMVLRVAFAVEAPGVIKRGSDLNRRRHPRGDRRGKRQLFGDRHAGSGDRWGRETAK